MIFRQLYEHETSTYTYILADETTKEALIIDSVLETASRDIQLIKELDLNLKYILETHVHADHITGAAELKKVSTAKTVVSKNANISCADILVSDNEELKLGAHIVKVLETPGHTNTCLSFLADNKIFTGDALLIRGCGRTDFQDGSPKKLYNSVQNKIFNLPDNTLVYPGHDYKGLTVSSIKEEKSYNPRLKIGTTLETFQSIMDNLNLPHPKKIDIAVPGNLVCGRLQD